MLGGGSFLVVLAVLAPSLARADAASPWFETEQGKVRLIAAAPSLGDAQRVVLGLQFELAPHWKIYWRSPGDAGYPPHLDWSGSDNLSNAEIAWPAPERFAVGAIGNYGYKGSADLRTQGTTT